MHFFGLTAVLQVARRRPAPSYLNLAASNSIPPHHVFLLPRRGLKQVD